MLRRKESERRRKRKKAHMKELMRRRIKGRRTKPAGRLNRDFFNETFCEDLLMDRLEF